MILRPRLVEAFLTHHSQVMLVHVAAVRGSTPREAGTYMLVSPDRVLGTIGGGQLEYLAIDTARKLLGTGVDRHDLDIPLGPGIGQCCGGHVSLHFAQADRTRAGDLLRRAQAEEAALREIYVFGAGHVGRALATALTPLPYRTVIVDTRRSEMDLVTADVDRQVLALPEAAVRQAKPGSVFVALTHDHALDFMITGEALKRDDAAYVGMIGSKTKKAQFKRWFLEQEGTIDQLDMLICPIGGGKSGDKAPEIIAALTVAEIIGKISQQGCPSPAESASMGENTGDR